MSQHPRREVGPFGARACVMLVLAVLLGLVAMHGLAPGTAFASTGTVSATAGTTAPAEAHDDPAGCDCAEEVHLNGVHEDHHDGGGGHVSHADATCAASGTTAAPVLPPLVPSGAWTQPAADHPLASAFEAPPGIHDPPSLSELQLLRI
ncbi:DUF6153 family protein [Streptomyces pristinaespiralis]|jgi:hypothetical protein|uniref:DUF6153 family protein n=1 Tax=Streptomyces pristinaespiralis TaxID=38300 RepID=UPI003833423E